MPLMGVGVGAGMGAGMAGVGVGAAVSPNDPFRNQPPITQRDVPVACELLDASLHDRGNPNAVNEISQRNGIDLRRATYLMAKFTMGANIINGTVSSAAASRAAANPTPSELEVMRENWPEISRAMGL
jgi:hypothetical protein